MTAGRLRVAWFSPIRGGRCPKDSLSAYFTHYVVPLLRSEFDVDIYQAEQAHLKAPGVYHFLEAQRRHAQSPYHLYFYQVEDKACSHFVRSCLGLRPGVTLFHDVLFTRPSAEALLHSPWQLIAQGLSIPEEIRWPDEEVWALSESPFGLREFSSAALPLFSNAWAHHAFRQTIHENPDAGRLNQIVCHGRSYYLPVPCVAPSHTVRSPAEPLHIAVVSSAGLEGRAHKLFQALSEVHVPYEITWLASEGHEHLRLQELADEFGVSCVCILRSPEQWALTLTWCDIAVHLHYSVYGNLSPYVEMSCCAGKMVLVSDFGTSNYVQGDSVIRVIPGDREVAQLKEAFLLSQRDLSVLRSASTRDGRGANTFTTFEDAATELQILFRQHQADFSAVNRRWERVRSSAQNWMKRRYNAWFDSRFDLLSVEGREQSREFVEQLRGIELSLLPSMRSTEL
jgi:hypothetical protein